MILRRFTLLSLIILLATLFSCGNKNKIEVDHLQNQTALSQEERAIPKSEHREWYSFSEGMELANAGDKHIIIDFYTDWCKWCKVMDEKTFSVPEVQDYLFEHFIPIHLDAESEETATFKGQTYTFRELTRTFGVTGFPSLAYLSPTKEMVTLVPGYIEKDRFMDILQYVSKECYVKQIPFDSFKEDGDCL
ncbi:thioredoxin fold domain-containing protein [bacterium]|nr:thioredoxin fold domain-containing protein [bacterium]